MTMYLYSAHHTAAIVYTFGGTTHKTLEDQLVIYDSLNQLSLVKTALLVRGQPDLTQILTLAPKVAYPLLL